MEGLPDLSKLVEKVIGAALIGVLLGLVAFGVEISMHYHYWTSHRKDQ